MFKLFLSLFDKLKNNYHIVKEILYLRKIKPKYLFFSENKTYQKYTYLLIETLVKKYPNEVYYVSADINDKINNIGVRNIFIGKGFLMNIFCYFHGINSQRKLWVLIWTVAQGDGLN